MKSINSIRCILIDDHVEEHEVFSLALKMSNLPVVCHYYFFADEAFEILFHKLTPGPKVIFLDMNIPRMNGIDFLQRIRRTEHLKHIPVFAYSLGEYSETRQQALDLGVVDYLIKPDTREQLVEILVKALEPYIE